jgi:hypothetical protein
MTKQKPEPADPEHVKYGDTLLQSMQESQDQYDKSIITLSSGALGLSFAFIDKLVHLDHAQGKWVLLASWIFWAGAISSTLASFYFSQKAMELAYNKWQAKEYDFKNPSDKLTRSLNLISGLAFLSGVIELICFVYMNLR